MPCRLVLLLSVLIVSPAFGQRTISNKQTTRKQAIKNEISVDDAIEKEGTIISLTHLKDGKIKMKFQADETQEFTLDWKTLIYKLTDRNRKIYKEEDKLADIIADANKLRQVVKQIPDKETELLAHSWTSYHVSPVTGNVRVWNHVNRRALEGLSKAQTEYWRDEENRQNLYGPPVKLVPKMTALVVVDRTKDVTYAVLVTGKIEEPKKEKKEKVAESPGQDRETEAARKLKYAKQLLKDSEAAKGEERERLSELANKKLQEVVDKFEGSNAAKEAQGLLDKK
jgi:hypothetical protein